MNKPLYIVGVLLIYLSIAGLVYAAFNPIVDTCASTTLKGPFTIPVCSRQESTNWIGYGISLTALASSIILIKRSLRGTQKKR